MSIFGKQEVDPIPVESQVEVERKVMDCLTPCLLNPGDGAVLTRVNRQDAWEAHNQRRRESNDNTQDKALDSIDLFLARSMAMQFHFSNVAAGVALSTEDTANEVASDTEDTSAETIATSNAAVATSLGNLASALVPIIAGTSGVVSVQTLAAVLATVVASAGQAAGTSNSGGTK